MTVETLEKAKRLSEEIVECGQKKKALSCMKNSVYLKNNCGDSVGLGPEIRNIIIQIAVAHYSEKLERLQAEFDALA